MTVAVQSAIVHLINKKVGTPSEVTKVGSSLTPGGPLTNLISKVDEFFEGRRSVIYGIFDPDEKYKAKSWIREYLDGNLDFVKCTHEITDSLSLLMDQKSWATGGYLLMAHYRNDSSNYFVVVMINNVDGVTIDDDLTVKLTKHLELDRLHQAVRLSVSSWNNQTDDYLAFVRAKKTDDVAQYFFESMGCTAHQNSAKDTAKVMAAIKSYLKEINATGDQRVLLRSRSFDYLDSSRKDGREATLAGIEAALHLDNPSIGFVAFMRKRGYQISDGFTVHKNIKRMKQYYSSGENYRLSFHDDALDDELSFDPNAKTLLVKKLSPRALKRLTERIGHES